MSFNTSCNRVSRIDSILCRPDSRIVKEHNDDDGDDDDDESKSGEVSLWAYAGDIEAQ